MADELDRAQAASEVYERAAMQSLARRRTFQPIPGGRQWLECEDCGKPIPHARLKANPAATRCVSCQETHERGGAR